MPTAFAMLKIIAVSYRSLFIESLLPRWEEARWGGDAAVMFPERAYFKIQRARHCTTKPCL